ncbi:unnamed protein product [Paramecium pentaurelia]|uniref:Uncharacterized protein n=1 Tax=Paramecium pentaurelia TaxID=43138 RepID=A0A8S1WFD2_9CILI|nr:unnamed protein product [Paramecium pentaurelia]
MQFQVFCKTQVQRQPQEYAFYKILALKICNQLITHDRVLKDKNWVNLKQMTQFQLILLKLNSDIEFQQVQDRQILKILQLKKIRQYDNNYNFIFSETLISNDKSIGIFCITGMRRYLEMFKGKFKMQIREIKDDDDPFQKDNPVHGQTII